MTKTSIHTKLFALRKYIMAGGITKNSKASVKTKTGQTYTYTYPNLANILEAIQPALEQHKILLTQPTETQENGSQAVVTRLTCIETGESVESTWVKSSNGNPQDKGSEDTYYRRYGLMGLLATAAEDDDGKQASKPREPKVDHVQAVFDLATRLKEDSPYLKDQITQILVDNKMLILNEGDGTYQRNKYSTKHIAAKNALNSLAAQTDNGHETFDN